MALQYKKITEQEDQMRHLLEKGEYPFHVKSIKEGKTKNNKYDMLTLDIAVMDINGREITVKDWVVLMDEMAWKLRHLAATCDVLNLYDDNLLQSKDFLGKNGVVKLGIREYENEEHEKRLVNYVIDYIKPDCAKKSDSFLDDDIPL